MTKDSASGGQVNGPNVEPTNDLRQHRPPFSPPKSPRNNVFTASCFRLLRSSLNESLPSLYIPELFSFRDREGTEIAFFFPFFLSLFFLFVSSCAISKRERFNSCSDYRCLENVIYRTISSNHAPPFSLSDTRFFGNVLNFSKLFGPTVTSKSSSNLDCPQHL